MAYPIGSAALALGQIDNALFGLKSRLNGAIATAAAGDVSAEWVVNIHTEIKLTHAFLTEQKAAPGLAAYAITAKGLPGLDIVAEFNAILAALILVRDWIETNMTAGAGDWLQYAKWTANTFTLHVYTPAQTGGLRTRLQALVDLMAD